MSKEKDLLQIAHSAMSDVDVRVLPTQVGINLGAAKTLIRNHLIEVDAPAPAKKKAAKRKKKVAKKK